VTGNTSAPYVDNHAYSAKSGETQTLQANSPGDWVVTNNTLKGNTSVTSYPNTGASYNEQPVSKFSSITSTYTDFMPHNSTTSGWAAEDLWFNNWADEVMIQYDFTNNGPCAYEAVQQFGGQTWGLCVFGSERVWKLAPAGTKVGGSATINQPSGTIDVKAMITWLEGNGYLPANSTITNLSTGFEICSTGGVPEKWGYSAYTMNAKL